MANDPTPELLEHATRTLRGETSERSPAQKRGRKTAYSKEYAEWARKFFLLNQNATNDQLAEFLNITRSTLYRWQDKHPEFRDSIESGKAKANAELASSLFSLANGAETWEEKALQTENGVEIVKVRKLNPPSFPALRLALFNREREIWRQETDPGLDARRAVDMLELFREYARRFGEEAAQRIASDHGYSGLVIDGQARDITDEK